MVSVNLNIQQSIKKRERHFFKMIACIKIPRGMYMSACALSWTIMMAMAFFTSSVEATELPHLHKELGVHNKPACSSTASNGVENVEKFSRWFGRRPDRVLDFTWIPSWPAMVHSTELLTKCWHDAGYTSLTYSVGMLPRQDDVSLAQGAEGAYDDYFRKIATILVTAGYGDAIIRLGHEFNIPNYPWAAAKDPANFVIYWRRIVDVMRSVPGAQFRFDWNPSLNINYKWKGSIPPDQVYPGDDYVDIIGLDVYNLWYGRSDATPDERWQKRFLTPPYGLQWQKEFAGRHGKQISFPEWGTGTRPDGHGGGDDPTFINHMADWIARNDVAYHDYWDMHASEDDCNISDGGQPKAGSAFKQAFGGR
jgi:hypothetical protein